MILGVKDRILLCQILPQPGPTAALRLRMRVALKPEEMEKIKGRMEGEKFIWDPDVGHEIEFNPTVRQQIYLSDLLEQMSFEGKITAEMLGLVDRFVLARE